MAMATNDLEGRTRGSDEEEEVRVELVGGELAAVDDSDGELARNGGDPETKAEGESSEDRRQIGAES
jgi:hypothetical protein